MNKVEIILRQQGLDMIPKPISILTTIIKNKFKGISINSALSITLAIYSKCLCLKRIKVKEFENLISPNLYIINFVPSGYGKDKIVEDIDKHFFKKIKDWLNNKSKDYIAKKELEIEQQAQLKYANSKNKQTKIEDFIESEKRKIRKIVLDLSNATPEGVFADAKALNEAGFGCIFVKIGELGLFLLNATNEQKVFINQLFEAYSGKIVAKSIKSEAREDDIEDLPVVALLYSDPTIFEREFKKAFDALLETGLARRCIISFMNKKEKYELETDYEKAYKADERYYSNLIKLGDYFYKTFEQIEMNAVYELAKEAFIPLQKYKIKLKVEEENADNSLLAKEIASRELKVLRVAGICAPLNHPKDLFIHAKDVEQAIEIVEKLSGDFKRFINHKPKYSDKYEQLFNFFLENIDKAFTKTELINKHYQEFGTSRDKARNDFDEYIEIISEIARDKGYFLQIESINKNSGKSYKLTKIAPKELSEEILPLDKLIEEAVPCKS